MNSTKTNLIACPLGDKHADIQQFKTTFHHRTVDPGQYFFLTDPDPTCQM